MEQMVLPVSPMSIRRTGPGDELPQSAAGKTIMTTEPKFVPKEAARIDLGEDTAVKVRLVDCVGFMTEGASGHMENEKERLVKTPWFEESIPFTMAAEIGTRKVIRDHSTIGLVITTDGSFGELERQAYIKPEETGSPGASGDRKTVSGAFKLQPPVFRGDQESGPGTGNEIWGLCHAGEL